MTMKRPKITGDMIAGLLVFGVAFLGYMIGMQETNKSNQCTPTTEHQEVIATLSGIQLQISEENQQCMFLLDKYIK